MPELAANPADGEPVPAMDVHDPQLIQEFQAAVQRGNESVKASEKEAERQKGGQKERKRRS